MNPPSSVAHHVAHHILRHVVHDTPLPSITLDFIRSVRIDVYLEVVTIACANRGNDEGRHIDEVKGSMTIQAVSHAAYKIENKTKYSFGKGIS